MVSPFAMHHQQLAMLAQQQSLLMAAASKSAGGDPKLFSSFQHPGPNGTNLPSPNLPNLGNQIPAMMMPGGQAELQKFMQVESITAPVSIHNAL